jgi:ubiquitin-conjugating enzyme E2 G2
LLDPPEGLLAGPITEDNFFEWEAVIVGPVDTPCNFLKKFFLANLIFFVFLCMYGHSQTFSILLFSKLIDEYGCFTTKLTFPADYPFAPPKMTFTSTMWHPNVYKNGNLRTL